jgi:hypothetical protein
VALAKVPCEELNLDTGLELGSITLSLNPVGCQILILKLLETVTKIIIVAVAERMRGIMELVLNIIDEAILTTDLNRLGVADSRE